jgi:hypothetical protein
MSSELFFAEEIISQYTSEEAVEDGILVRTSDIEPGASRSFFSHITTNLLNQGYIAPGDSESNDLGPMRIIMPHFKDLIIQANAIVTVNKTSTVPVDTFFSKEIKFPDGTFQRILIAQNETGKFTIMLPEDG